MEPSKHEEEALSCPDPQLQSKLEDVLCDLNAWQIKRIVMVCLIFIPGGALISAMPFATFQQDFWCEALGKSNETLNVCVEGCEEYKFDQSEFQNSIRMDYGLICERQYFETLAKLSMFGGYGIGTFLIGIISDNFGRKIGLIISSQLLLCSGIAATLMATFLGFSILWFILGMSCISVFTVGFVWIMEIVGMDSKVSVSLLASTTFSLGLLPNVLAAYLVRDYRILYQGFAGLHLITPILLLWIPESPRWLLSQNSVKKHDEAIKTLNKIAKSKGLSFDPKYFKRNMSTTDKKWEEVDRFSLIFTNARLRTRAFAMFFCWFTVACVMYSLSMNMKSLTGSLFLNMGLVGIFGFMGKIVGFSILTKFSTRRNPAIMLFFMVALTNGLCSLLDQFNTAQRFFLSGLVIFAILCLSSLFAIIWLYTAEIYPTAIRNFGVGSSSFIGRIGGAGCAFIVYLIEIYPSLPFIIFAGMCFMAGCLAWLLPETGKLPPPSSMKEIEQREAQSKLKRHSLERV